MANEATKADLIAAKEKLAEVVANIGNLTGDIATLNATAARLQTRIDELEAGGGTVDAELIALVSEIKTEAANLATSTKSLADLTPDGSGEPPPGDPAPNV